MKDSIIMIAVPDGRRFFTQENNLPMLTEYARTSGSQISVVDSIPKGVEILDLPILAKKICDQEYGNNTPEVNVLQVKIKSSPIASSVHFRDNKTKTSLAVTKISEMFTSGEEVNYDNFTKLSGTNLSRSLFSTCLSQVRKTLLQKGINVRRVKNGSYQIQVIES